MSGGAYQWSTGAITPAITVANPGAYTVTITGETGCSTTENILVELASGAGEPATRLWRVWPNLVREQVFIDCPDCDASGLRVRLYDARGQLLGQQSGAVVHVNRLPAGLYWLELFDGGEYVGVQKVVKGH